MSVRRRAWTTSKGEAREAWIVNYSDVAGVRHIGTCGSKREADAYEAAVKTAVRAGTHTAPSTSPTIAEAAQAWLTFVAGEGREQTTRKQYEEHVRLHINPRIGREKLAQLTTPAINRFRDDLLSGLSRPMAKKVLTSLKSILKDAQRRGDVAQNVALGVSIVMASRDKRKLMVGVDIPSADEIRSLFAASGALRPVLIVATFTGLRSSELRGITWADVDFAQGVLHVRQRADRFNMIGRPKSAAGERVIPIGPMVVNTLKEWKLACPKGVRDLVFANARGEIMPYQTLRWRFDAAQVAAGLSLSVGQPKYAWHALRHFYASWCINRRVDGGLELPLKTVQDRLGHSSITMTADTYGHLFPSRDDGAELAHAERLLAGPHLVGAT
jgi:integrase